MSLHRPETFHGQTPHMPAGEIITGDSDGKSDDRARRSGARWSPSSSAANDIPDELRVQLRHMGLDVVISLTGSNFGPAIQIAETDGSPNSTPTVHLQVADESVARCLDLLLDGKGTHSMAPFVAVDPVISKLANALNAAAHSNSEFSGIYMDSIRLSIVNHLLSHRRYFAD